MNNNHPKDHSSEKLLDSYIDLLNDKNPNDDDGTKNYIPSEEEKELVSLAQTVKFMDAEPSEEFVANLWHKLESETEVLNPSSSLTENRKFTPNRSPSTPKKFVPWAGLAASILVSIIFFSAWSGTEQNIVLAMEKSMKQLQNYHGILEKVSTNGAGENQVLSRTEIWSEGEKYATKTQEGLLTVNNGETRWSANPTTQEISLLPIYLDPHDFDLKKEAAKALSYSHQILGEDIIADRTATRLEIQPPGGLPYSLWIDQETNLPIQLQTAKLKSLQTTYTYVNLDINTTFTDKVFVYDPPRDYKIVDKNPDKLVGSLADALRVSGINPLQTADTPQRIFSSINRIAFDFGDTVVIQTKANLPFVPHILATLGKAEDGFLEILPDSLRWQQNSLEIHVRGKRVEELAQQLSASLDYTPQVAATPQEDVIGVEIDMEMLKNSQQQVDAGSSPWQLDPTQVAFTFVALKISPEGINGAPPLEDDSLQLTANDGKKAIVKVSDGPVETVYLERLIRQDETGIWAVTGYKDR